MDKDRGEPAVVVRGGSGRLAALLVGLAVGAGAALLLAPQSGAATRADISRQVRRARRAARRMVEDVKERAEDAYATVRRDVRHHTAEVQHGVEGVIDDVRSRVAAGREAGKAGAKAAREELHRRLGDVSAGVNGDDA